MRGKSLLITLLLVGILLLASCGGGGTPLAGTPGGTTGDQTANEEPAAQTFDEWTARTDVGGTKLEEPAATVDYRALPNIPVDSGHGSSAADYTQTVLGAAAIDFSQCTVNGDAMIINDGAAADTNPEGIPAWALYKISGLTDLEPVSLNTECLVGASGMEYSVAVADYTAMEWKWYGPTTLPEYQADLADDHSYITNIGNLYFLVVCYGENTATHAQSTIVANEPITATLPGAPGELVASKGEIEGGVGLEWLPGAGADYYEIFRQDELWFYGGDPVPGFDPAGEWVLLDSTEDTSYFDEAVEPGIVYMYKVRSVNTAGYSNFSNIDEGWAFDEVEPPFDGIHGWVWGEEWNCWEDDDPPPGNDFDPAGGGCFPRMFPLEGATITLAFNDPAGSLDFVYTTMSDADGFYRFDDEILEGEYLLFCELAGWIFYEQYVVIIDGEVVPEQFDFYGFPEGSDPPYIPEDGIHGWVWGEYWDEGDPRFGMLPPILPLENALIQVFNPESDIVVDECYTDADGFFQFLELPAGEYMMTCELENWFFDPEMHFFGIPEDGMPSLAFDFFGHCDGYEPPDPEPLPVGLSGYVWNMATETGEILPMPGVDINVLSDDGMIAYTLTTDRAGFFHLPEIVAGHYLVTAYYEGYVFEPPEHPVVFNADDMDPVQVDFMGWLDRTNPGPGPGPGIPEGLAGWAFCLGDPAGNDGFYPVPDALVTVTPANGLGIVYTASTDPEGYFEVPISDFGLYTAVITKEGYTFDPVSIEFELTEDEPFTVVEFVAFENRD